MTEVKEPLVLNFVSVLICLPVISSLFVRCKGSHLRDQSSHFSVTGCKDHVTGQRCVYPQIKENYYTHIIHTYNNHFSKASSQCLSLAFEYTTEEKSKVLLLAGS